MYILFLFVSANHWLSGKKPDVWSSPTTSGHSSNEVNGLEHCRGWVGAVLDVAEQSNLKFISTPIATSLGGGPTVLRV